MKSRVHILRFVLGAVLVVASSLLLAGWWLARQALPQLDGEITIPELAAAVNVTRDRWGVPRIRAASLEDLVTAQGYVAAQDRLWQMDVLRRAAAGELSEIFGEATLEVDRENRTLGLGVAAEKQADSLDEEGRKILDAYARGVNRYIADRRSRLPIEFQILRYQPKPWSPRDTVLVGAYMYKLLTETWKMELKRGKVTARLGPELARQLYVVDSPLDHFVVGERSDRGGSPRGNTRAKKALMRAVAISPVERLSQAGAADELLARFREETEYVAGSNNWVISGAHTISGKPLLANDTHLPLAVPCLWSIMHLTAPGWNVKGFVLPGTPLVIIGHNERMAWGFTNNGADVQDLYIETLNPANPRQYRVNGEWRDAEIRRETIRVRGGSDVALEVTSTRHGPVVHREGGRAFALRWTATEPGGMTLGYSWLGRAQNWTEFRQNLRRVTGPAQNIVYADVEGNIGFSVAARVPVRKRGFGEVPVPGDTDDYEWNGYIPFEDLPSAYNPANGIIATANARVAGPEFRPYLTDHWVAPYRTNRIYALLSEAKKFRAADFLAIQTDVVSTPHRLLAEHLLNAARSAQPTDARARELLRRIPAWDGQASASSPVMAFLEYTRRSLRKRILETQLGDDATLYDWFRSEVFLQNVLRERPGEWLPREFAGATQGASQGYDALLIRCMDDAVAGLSREAGSNKLEDWRWGRYISLMILHPMARSGFLRRHWSIGPIPQSGASHTVKQTGRTFGPAMRFVADLSNFDGSLMNVTLGESGQYLSAHYRDQFPYWYEGRGIYSSFSEPAAEKAAVHHLRMVPR